MALLAVGLFLTREKFLSFFERFNKNNVFPACERYNAPEDDFLQAFHAIHRGVFDIWGICFCKLPEGVGYR
jgi:hypothetical protein